MISIIIPAYNARQTVENCLAALHNQTYTDESEIIFVDSSTDGTAKFVAEKFPEVKIIHRSQRTDPGTARNLGIQQSHGDILAFIDADCVAAPDWLEKHVQAHVKPYIGIGGAICNSPESQNAVGYAGYLSEFREFIPEQRAGEVRHAPTCNISYKKSAFEKYGLFSADFYPQEDLVFNFQLVKSGEKIWFEPSIRVEHVHRVRLRDFLQHQQRIGNITARVLQHFRMTGSTLVYHPFIAFPAILAIPLVKFIRTLTVFLRLRPGITKQPLALFIFGLGLSKWTLGFLAAVYPLPDASEKTQRLPEFQTKIPEVPVNLP